MSSRDFHAVVTGDIVGSTNLPRERRESLPDMLRRIYGDLRGDSDALRYDIAIGSGDRWQFHVEEPGLALTALLAFWTRLSVEEIQTRAAIAIDRIDFISDGNLNESDGAAFRQSGRSLDDMGANELIVGAVPNDVPRIYSISMEGLCELVDSLAHEWTQAQCRTLAEKMTGRLHHSEMTQAEIAARWEPEPITKQAVGAHLRKAKWKRLVRTDERFHGMVEELENDYSSG